MDIYRTEVEKYKTHLVTKVTLVNDNGVSISCLTMGATWQEFSVPQADGSKKNLLLSFDKPADYYANGLCTCQSIGRVAGRIKDGRFKLDGKEIQLPQNEKGNCLHGGAHGFNHTNWKYTTSRNDSSVSVIFQQKIRQAIDGFPGDILATVIYTLDNSNRVTIAYSALGGEVDTLFNPTCHVYFNLSNRQDLSTHSLQINSDGYLETDDELIPTGRVKDVEASPYDFRKMKNLQVAIAENHGFDDVFVVNGPGKATMPIAVLRDDESGDQVTIDSDRNGLVMYTMHEIEPGIYFSRDNGKEAIGGEGIALEAQTLPDAINQANFGDIVLPRQGKKTYRIQFAYDNVLPKE